MKLLSLCLFQVECLLGRLNESLQPRWGGTSLFLAPFCGVVGGSHSVWMGQEGEKRGRKRREGISSGIFQSNSANRRHNNPLSTKKFVDQVRMPPSPSFKKESEKNG